MAGQVLERRARSRRGEDDVAGSGLLGLERSEQCRKIGRRSVDGHDEGVIHGANPNGRDERGGPGSHEGREGKKARVCALAS